MQGSSLNRQSNGNLIQIQIIVNKCFIVYALARFLAKPVIINLNKRMNYHEPCKVILIPTITIISL